MSQISRWVNFAGRVCLCLPLFMAAGSSSAQHFISPPEIDPTAIEPMKSWLIQHWLPGTENRKVVEQQFSVANRQTSGLTLAYVANRLHDSRRSEALKALEAATIQDTKFLDAWLLRAHLEILSDQFSPGLVSLRSAKRAFAENEATPVQRTEFYRRVGELSGYLQGPVANRVDQPLLNSIVDQLLLGAAEPDVATFQAAAEQIRTQYLDQVKATQERLDTELEKQAQVDANLQVTLTQQNQSLQQNEQVLRSRQTQLNDEFAQRESQLTSQLSPLQANVIGIENQIASLQLTLQYLYADLAHAQNQRVVYWLTVQAISDQIRRTEAQLINLQLNYQSYLTQLSGLQAQIHSTRKLHQDQIKQIQSELKKTSSTLAKNNNQLNRIAAGPTVARGKKEAESNRVSALGSYVNLSADLIRQELLELLE